MPDLRPPGLVKPDIIERAGQNQQVIVFTCRARSFATLGGRQLTIA